MKEQIILCCLLLAAISPVANARIFNPNLQQWLGLGRHRHATKEVNGDLWAVLIAGSAGWGNYRHQADVAHAYQILHRGGVPNERIIVMVYDDIADNPENPRPGTLINHPTGLDVYAGMPRDYTKGQVNAENFLAVLAGNKSAVLAGSHSSGRVVEAGPSDRIFVFYSDHGAPGIVGMPSGDFLYADKLHAVIKRRAKHGGFGEMVFYLEACESGSMFDGLLEDSLGVYVTTAANGRESSWGVYCPGMDPSPPAEFNTCLGDLYSVSWMEDSEANDLSLESLKKQFQRVRMRTSQNYSYTQGSHVERFGAVEISEEVAGRYLGSGPLQKKEAGLSSRLEEANETWTALEAVPQRDADLVPLMTTAHRHKGTSKGEEAAQQLAAERARRQALDRKVLAAVTRLTRQDAAHGALLTGVNPAELLSEPVPAPDGSAALVSDWDCLRGMMAVWAEACGPLDQYGMKHSRAFANLCNLGKTPADLHSVGAVECGRHHNILPKLRKF